MNIRLFASVSSAFALTAAIVACSAPAEPNGENVGAQEQAICLNYPCIPPRTNRFGSTSGGLVFVDDGPISFTCNKQPVPGDTHGYIYEVQPNGMCAIVDPYGCQDAGAAGSNFVAKVQPDGGCWGTTFISYYVCPVNHPNMSCNAYTGACSCY